MKLNVWKNMKLPKVGYFIKTIKPYHRGKELFNDSTEVGWTAIKNGLCFIGKKNSIRKDIITEELPFSSLSISAQLRIIHSYFKSFAQKVGFTHNNRNDIFFLKSSSSNLLLRRNKQSDIFINIGFKYSIEVLSNRIVVLINPYQVTTSDGENYNSRFSELNNARVLADKDIAPSYRNFCDMYEGIISLLSPNNPNLITIDCFDSGEIVLKESNEISPQIIEEPNLYFGVGKLAKWPKLGLNRYHPLDYNSGMQNRPENINVVLVGSKNSFSMLNQLKNGQKGLQYPYKGFDKIYKSNLVMGKDRFIELTENEIKSIDSIYSISDLLISKIVELRNKQINFDLCLIELDKEWETYFSGQEKDLHDLIKSKAWLEKIPTQLFKYFESNNAEKLTDFLGHLGLGIYFKSGGNPWRVNSAFRKNAYVGISFGYSEIDKKRLIGIAEIFDAYGQFISIRSITIKEKELFESIYEKREVHLSRGQLSQLLNNLLTDYHSFMDGEFPENLIVHKTTYFNKIEMSDIQALTSFPTSITLVYVQDKSNWHIIDSNKKEPTRGSYIELTDSKAIIYTSGIMQGQRSYFLPGTPKPYLIKVSEGGAFSVKQVSEQIMEITKLNFNSTNTYSRHPITILHARKLVNLLRVGMPSTNIPTDPRFYI